jgi:hypothetical protein
VRNSANIDDWRVGFCGVCGGRSGFTYSDSTEIDASDVGSAGKENGGRVKVNGGRIRRTEAMVS